MGYGRAGLENRLADLIFNKYAIQARLAVGGMGEVFYAVHKGAPGFERPAILKRLLPALASQDGFIEQFLDEARVAATLNHPNVVSILEVGPWDGGYFIAMEYIRGRNLAQLLRASIRTASPVPPVVTASIIHDAALGLHHAHTAHDANGKALNIVHRDISPENIMVRDDGVTKVVDFGIAHASNRAHRAETGALTGKPAYLAPEQQLSLELSAATDQFALGIVLWEMACGKRLPQSKLPPSQVVAGVPAEFDAITMRMLDPDPNRRFSSCAEVAQALDQFLLGHSGGTGREARVAAYLQALGPSDPVMPPVTPSFKRERGAPPKLRLPMISIVAGMLAIAAGASTYVILRPPLRAGAAEAPGYLTLTTEPWTRVSVAGAPLGATPLVRARLAAGKQTLTLLNEEAGIRTTREVTIKPGEVTRVQLKLP